MKNDLRNTYYNVLDSVFLPLIMIGITPIFISYLGIEQYGIWMLINSLMIAMTLLNIGGSDTVIKYISEYRKSNNVVGISEVFSTVFLMQLVFTFIIVIFGVISIPYLVESNLFNIDETNSEKFAIALKFGFLIFSIKIIEQINIAYFKGYENFSLATKISILSKFILILIQLLSVTNGAEIDYIFINSFIVMFLILIFEIIYIKSTNQKITFLSNFKFDRLKEIIYFTKWSWAISILGTLSTQADRWIIGHIGNMQLLGYYSIVFIVFNNIHSIFASSVSWIFPKISKENDNKELILKYYFLLQGILLFFSMLGSLFLIIFNEIFLLWLGDNLYYKIDNYLFEALLILPLASLSIVSFFIIKGTGNIKYIANLEIITFLTRVILIFYFYELYGLSGVIYAMGISFFVGIVYILNVLNYSIFKDIKLYVYRTISIPLLYIFMMLSENIYVKIIVIIIITYLYYKIFFIKIVNEYLLFKERKKIE